MKSVATRAKPDASPAPAPRVDYMICKLCGGSLLTFDGLLWMHPWELEASLAVA